jgi:PhzF family phenazine biosynthesis protein
MAMKSKRFWQVDAFTTQPYCGNPAAIVFDADDLSTETMQAISREMNLSETVFVRILS